MPKAKKINSIRGADLVIAIKGFTPIFGSEMDRMIVARIAAHDAKLESVDHEILRSGRDLTPKMKEILRDEKGLVEWIVNRNMDF